MKRRGRKVEFSECEDFCRVKVTWGSRVCRGSGWRACTAWNRLRPVDSRSIRIWGSPRASKRPAPDTQFQLNSTLRQPNTTRRQQISSNHRNIRRNFSEFHQVTWHALSQSGTFDWAGVSEAHSAAIWLETIKWPHLFQCASSPSIRWVNMATLSPTPHGKFLKNSKFLAKIIRN